MNRAEIATATRRYLNELSVAYMGAQMMYDAINEAYRQLNDDARYYRTTTWIDISSGQMQYQMSASVMDVYRVRLGTGAFATRLKPTDIHRVDTENDSWESVSGGTPAEYYTNGGVLGLVNPPPAVRPAWQANKSYSPGDIVRPTTPNGYWYRCTKAGTSGSSQPSWPTEKGASVTDGSVQWTVGGSTRVYMLVLSDVPALSAATSVPVFPTRFHHTIAKLAAINIAGGYNADSRGSQPRIAKLYQEYLAERDRLRALAANRTREYMPRVMVVGYDTFRR